MEYQSLSQIPAKGEVDILGALKKTGIDPETAAYPIILTRRDENAMGGYVGLVSIIEQGVPVSRAKILAKHPGSIVIWTKEEK